MDSDPINHSGSGQSPEGACGRLTINLVRPGQGNIQSMESVDQIYPGHLNPPKIIFQCISFNGFLL